MRRAAHSVPALIMVAVLTLSNIVMAAAVSNHDATGANTYPFSTGEPSVVRFAALLPFSGRLAKLGESVRVAVELAIDEINEYFTNRSIPLQIAFTFKDTQSDPAVALARLQEAWQEGVVPIVLGPDSSAEVAAVMDFANEQGILLISLASTAPSLSIADDNVYRMMPNDRSEAEALAILAREVAELPYQADVVIPVYRNDLFGNDLLAAFTEEFTQRGGTVVEPGFPYDPGSPDFGGLVDELAEAVTRVVDEQNDARVAVYLIAFHEAVDLLRLARDHEPLSRVVWYGSNATAQSGALLQDEAAAAYAAEVGFLNPIFVPEMDTFQTVPVQRAEIRARIGREPETFALLARDTVWLMALSYLRSGVEEPDTEALRTALLQLTGEEGDYRGALGGHRPYLDEGGDIQYGSTGFFALEAGEDGYKWVRRAQLYRSPYHEPYWRFDLAPDPFERTAGLEGLTEDERRVTIGALLALMEGSLQADSRVADLRTALEFAQADINQYLTNIGSPYWIDLRIEDTQGDPEIALERLAALAAEGVSIVVGPTRSTVAEAILPYANEHGILLISPSSTATALAIPGDHLYRLVPDDRLQATALAELLVAEGIEAILPLYPEDIYGGELVALVAQAFQSAGGSVLEGDRYADDSRPGLQLDALGERVARAIEQYGADSVGVLFIAFEESPDILKAAAQTPHLTEVRWFGTDANALLDSLVNDPEAGRVAASVQLTSPFFRINPFDPLRDVFLKDYEVFVARLEAELGRPPIEYAASTYVGLWWAARAHFESGLSDDPADLKAALEAILRPEVGLPLTHITGPAQFNEAGDQTVGSYVFYRVRGEDDAFEWSEYAAYYNSYDLQGIVYR